MSEKLTKRRGWIIGGVAGVLVLGGGAVFATTAFADSDDEANEDSTRTVAEEDGQAPAAEPETTLSDAVATAADKVKNGVMTSVELEGKDASVWHVELISSGGTEHDVRINAADGNVSDHNKDSEDDADDWKEAKALNDKAKTSPEDAAATALDKAGKGTVFAVELDDEDDSDNPQWDVEVATSDGSQKEITVDATNGKVTSTDTDDDGDDDSDDDDDDSDDDDDN